MYHIERREKLLLHAEIKMLLLIHRKYYLAFTCVRDFATCLCDFSCQLWPAAKELAS